MAKHTITIHVQGSPKLQTTGEVKTVADAGRLFAKAYANIRGTEKFLHGFSAGKVLAVTIRPA